MTRAGVIVLGSKPQLHGPTLVPSSPHKALSSSFREETYRLGEVGISSAGDAWAPTAVAMGTARAFVGSYMYR